jgi:hypothetical protein
MPFLDQSKSPLAVTETRLQDVSFPSPPSFEQWQADDVVYIASLQDNSMLLAISGTNSSSSDSIHVDLDFLLVPTEPRDFPGGDEAGILIHKGFYEAFGRMRGEIGGVVLAGVGRGVKEITVVGHSMGKLWIFGPMHWPSKLTQ